MQYLGNACIFKHYPLFIWNKNLTVHPVFLIAKYCNPINKAVVVRVSNFKEPFSSVFLKPFRKKKKHLDIVHGDWKMASILCSETGKWFCLRWRAMHLMISWNFVPCWIIWKLPTQLLELISCILWHIQDSTHCTWILE